VADELSVQRMKRAALELSWSVTVRMLSKPLEGGNLMMRSMATVSKGRAAGVSWLRIGNFHFTYRVQLTLDVRVPLPHFMCPCLA
jgi:hypothetical protein